MVTCSMSVAAREDAAYHAGLLKWEVTVQMLSLWIVHNESGMN